MGVKENHVQALYPPTVSLCEGSPEAWGMARSGLSFRDLVYLARRHSLSSFTGALVAMDEIRGLA